MEMQRRCQRVGRPLDDGGVAHRGFREAETRGDSHLGPAVALKLSAKRINLSLEMLLPREKPILKQEAVLEIGEGPHHTRQVG